jgi:ligand-binding sensor domain-containing protein
MGVFKDSKNRLWIGTNKGNIRIDGQSVKEFNDSDTPLATSTLTKGFEDSNGNIWFSLYEKFPQTKGFAKLKIDGTWEIISTDNSEIPRNDVLDFAIDEKNNRIWLSLNRVGLSMFNGENWQTFTPENSNVPSTYIQSISIDERGNLWCATFAGLLKIKME